MQGKSGTPPQNPHRDEEESLEEQLRAQKEPIIEALTGVFRLALANEYPRLRGYMIEGETTQACIGLRCIVNLDPRNPGVQVQTLPEVNPKPFVQAAPITMRPQQP